MNRQDFISMLKMKNNDPISDRQFSFFADIVFDDNLDEPYHTTTTNITKQIIESLNDTPFENSVTTELLSEHIYGLVEESDFNPYPLRYKIAENQFKYNYQAYVSYNDLYNILCELNIVSCYHSIENTLNKNTTALNSHKPIVKSIWRIESNNSKGFYVESFYQLYIELVNFCINHHKSLNENDIADNFIARLNTPEEYINIEDMNNTIKYAISIGASIPNDYQFLMNDDHNIKTPSEDGILQIISNNSIGHDNLSKWFFAFHNKEQLHNWIKNANAHNTIKKLNAHIAEYSINDSFTLHSDNQIAFVKEHATLIQKETL